MNRTSKSSSLFSGTFSSFKSRLRKVSRATAGKNASKILATRSARKRPVGANPYQSAEIECDPACACDAVKRISGQRFLVRNVPPIPVPDCDSPDCQCTYVRYKDRRLWTEDRRAHYSLSTELYRLGDNCDKRKRKDRRVSRESVARSLTVADDFESWFR